MGWGGKGKGWSCYTCGYLNNYENAHCAGECQYWRKNAYSKGKGKWKGDYPLPMREDYPPQNMMMKIILLR
eukprot:3545346-Heterocapsa_arctica.AAC.1